MKNLIKTFLSRTLFPAAVLLLLAAGTRGRASSPVINLATPTNGSAFTAPATIAVTSQLADTNVVRTVQYFANGASIGMITNSASMLVTNLTQTNPFALTWRSVAAGSYSLLAVARESSGYAATSAPVNITVASATPVSGIAIYYPTNGLSYAEPANLTLYAGATEATGTVMSVEFFVNGASLGVVSNSSAAVFTNISRTLPMFPLAWSNVYAGAYALTAVSTDFGGYTMTSSVVNITVVTNTPPSRVPFAVSFSSPYDGETYALPAVVTLRTVVTDSNVVGQLQYFANGASLGVLTNSSGVLLTNSSQVNPFSLSWSNLVAGTYSLTAVALDSTGGSATSAPVSITISGPATGPDVSIYSPTNGSSFTAPARLGIYARALETTGTVASVQFFANGATLGIVSSQAVYTNISTQPLFALFWTNPPSGAYALTAVATDEIGNATTSAVVNVTILTNSPPPPAPFGVSLSSPTNTETYTVPAVVSLRTLVTDSNVVNEMQYFANGASIGTATNSSGVLLTNTSQANPFALSWSNSVAGTYSLTAVALDSAGNMATSAPVSIYMVTNSSTGTNASAPPVLSIYAPDPIAIMGTNIFSTFQPSSVASNYIGGANTATFLIHRAGATNSSLSAFYSIGGTASNGVDYATIASVVTIPANKTYALITITPLTINSASNYHGTVVLTLRTNPTATNTTYVIGTPASAGAVILGPNTPPVANAAIWNLADRSLHVAMPATNGMNSCLEVSTDLLNWQPVCTNTVVKSSAQFVDPSGSTSASFYYRFVPVATPATY